MKRLRIAPRFLATIACALALAAASVTIHVLAQQSAARTTDALEAATILYDQGQFDQAQPLFAAIETNSPAYGIALAYDALCRYEQCRAARTNHYRWFLTGLKALRAPAAQHALIPGELREDLALKEIDAVYRSHGFQSSKGLSMIADFKRAYPAPARADALAEYEMVARFELGMQRIYKASYAGNPARFQEPWTNGMADLEQFLSQAGKLPAEDYAILQDRSLAEDLQVALAVAAGQPEALAELSVRDPETWQRYGLICVGSHQMLHPEAWDQNLQLLAEFHKGLQAFPASRGRSRVERHLAMFGFSAGERLCAQALGAAPGGERSAAETRAAARRYFEIARAVQHAVVVDREADITPTDVASLRAAYFYSYYCEQDFAGMMESASAMLAASTPGDHDWLPARLFTGVALAYQTPPQMPEAYAAMDEVLARGFDGVQKKTYQDEVVMAAARWRVHLARRAGDKEQALKVLRWVEGSKAVEELKSSFLVDHAWVAGWVEAK